MPARHPHAILARVALVAGALALLATGADHLEEYTANHFSTVPTIGTLFLLNFIAATVVAVALLLPARMLGRRAAVVRPILALGGIGIAASSLAGLVISESSSLFGFMDNGYRPAIVAAIVAEVAAIVALGSYLALAGPRPVRRRSAAAH